MVQKSRSLFLGRTLPLVSFFILEWRLWHEERMKLCYCLASIPAASSQLSPYPVDMWPLLALPHGILDEAGVPYNIATKVYPAAYHPTTITQYALAQWNAYLTTGNERCKQAFMTQAHWLVAHETRLATNAGGWLIPFPAFGYNTSGTWMSALTQGSAISVLAYAYKLAGEDVFLQVARRAVRTFEQDIQEGGVSTSVGNDGIFFEEYPTYPTSHVLNGYIFALLGLYDYVAVTEDSHVSALIEHSLVTMHALIEQFDTGYWSRYDLLYRQPASYFYHHVHSVLLSALSRYSGCAHCAALAARWTRYQRNPRCRLYYFIMSRLARYRLKLHHVGVRGAFFRLLEVERQKVICNVSAPGIAQVGTCGSPSDKEVEK